MNSLKPKKSDFRTLYAGAEQLMGTFCWSCQVTEPLFVSLGW